MNIRKLRPEEKEPFVELVKDADNRNRQWAEAKFESYVYTRKKKCILVCEDGGKFIGFAGVKGEDIEENVSEEFNTEFALLTWVAVLPSYRKKGFGSLLVRECEKCSQSWGKRGVWLGCRDDALGFYEKNGYKQEGKFINEKGNEENLMVKKLGK